MKESARQSPVIKSIVLPAIGRHKSQASIKKKLAFETDSTKKYQNQQHSSSRQHTKRKVYGKEKGDDHGYKEFFVDPHVEEFNLRFSESHAKLQKPK